MPVAALVYSERDVLAHELISGAVSLGLGPVSVLLAGEVAAGRAADCFACGAVRALTSEAGLSDTAALAGLVAAATGQVGADVVLIGSTRRGKELAGRVAAILGAGCVTDAIGLQVADGRIIAQRYALGGSTVASERVSTVRQVYAVMPKAFEAARRPQPVGEMITAPAPAAPRVSVLERRPKGTDAVDLEAADRIVVVGKGLRARQDLAVVEELARALHAEIGCTRSLAAEYGWLSEERLIGLSGKKCKPRLYLGLGVSGQIQHTVGIAGARIIAAVNTDKEAPILKLADYGIVGDLYQVAPKLTALLR